MMSHKTKMRKIFNLNKSINTNNNQNNVEETCCNEGGSGV